MLAVHWDWYQSGASLLLRHISLITFNLTRQLLHDRSQWGFIFPFFLNVSGFELCAFFLHRKFSWIKMLRQCWFQLYTTGKNNKLFVYKITKILFFLHLCLSGPCTQISIPLLHGVDFYLIIRGKCWMLHALGGSFHIYPSLCLMRQRWDTFH